MQKSGEGSKSVGMIASEALVAAVDLNDKGGRKGKDRVGQDWWTNPNVDDAMIE